MSSTSSPFGQNEWLVEEMYRKFRDDPSSVDPSWHEFLVDYNPEPVQAGLSETSSASNGQVATSAPSAPPTPAPAPPAEKPATAKPEKAADNAASAKAAPAKPAP
ncbi:2-oxoglutarate dehydrogenase E1 subunit family protein, partial [Mycolicibacterium confluentis]